MTSIASRRGTECPRCEARLIAPEWSEQVGADSTVHLWRCWICGHEFETSDHQAVNAQPEAELIEEFWPNLLVA